MGRKPRHPCSLLWENYKSRRALSRGSNLEPPASHHVGHLFGNYVGHHVGHHVHLDVGYHWVKTCPTSQRTAKRVLGVGWKVVYNRILFMTWPLLPLTSYRARWGLFVLPRGEGSMCRNRRRTCLDNHAQRQCSDQQVENPTEVSVQHKAVERGAVGIFKVALHDALVSAGPVLSESHTYKWLLLNLYVYLGFDADKR